MPEKTCPQKLVTPDGAVYVLYKAPTDISQLNVDITAQLHQRLRTAADAHGISLRDYVENTLEARIAAEEGLYARA